MKIKKILYPLAVIGAVSLLFADTTTSRFALTKIDVGSTNWGPKINTNADLIDTAAGTALANTFTSSQTFNASATFAAQILAANGTVAAPEMSFTNFNTSGWCVYTGPFIAASIAGTKVFEIGASSVTSSQPLFTGTLNVTSSATAAAFEDNGVFNLAGEFKAGLTSSTSGQILVSQGAGISPKFQWGGPILQIVQGTVINASTSTTSTVYVQSGIKATIIPKQNGSTILAIAPLAAIRNSVTADSAYASIFRAGSNLASNSTDALAISQVSASVTSIMPATMFKPDSPATTSSTVYEVYFKTDAGGTATLSGSGLNCQMILVEIGQN